MDKIKIMIVDDHQIFRTGLFLLLNELDFVEIIDEANDGIELFKKLAIQQPDIVFMDIKMPKMGGIEATKKISEKYPNIKVIALSMHDDEKYLDSMLISGAKGFLSKEVGMEDLEKAITYVSNGRNYFSAELIGILADKVNPNRKDIKQEISLTQREKQVLQLICKGYLNHEIAEKLFISQRTVEAHKSKLLEKTNSKNSINLVLFAIRKNIVELNNE